MENLIIEKDLLPKRVSWKRAEIPTTRKQILTTFKHIAVTQYKGDGYLLYVAGTRHDKIECAEEVQKLLEKIEPDTLMIELCNHRLVSESEKVESSFSLLCQYIREMGTTVGCLRFINEWVDDYHSVTGYGKEMQKAITYGRSNQCSLELGDRPLIVTVQRQVSVLDRTLKSTIVAAAFASFLLPFRVKRRILDFVVKTLVMNHPKVKRVIVQERDLHLTYKLQNIVRERNGFKKVVAVIGMAHAPGVEKLWDTVTLDQVQKTMLPIVDLDELNALPETVEPDKYYNISISS